MKQLALFPEDAPPPRPLAGCVTEGWRRWCAMQRAFAKAEAKAVRLHRAVDPIRRARRSLVHAALEARA